jgi:very-short-patch-repair endonuclease
LGLRDSVLSGPSAARLHGIVIPRIASYLIVGRRSRPLAGTKIVVEHLDRRDVQVVDGVPVTTPERTVIDCALLLPESAALDLVEHALQRGLATVAGLADRIRRRIGRPGTPRLVRLVGKVAIGTHSAAERRLVALIRADRLDGWTANDPIYDDYGLVGRGDVVFRAERLVIEADGFAFHVTPEQFQNDRRRQNRLIASGWRVLRFTWRDLTERPDHVMRTIRHTRAARQRRSPSA